MTGSLSDSTDAELELTSGFSDTIQSLSGFGAVQLANGTVLTTGDATATTISGVMSGAGGLTKVEVEP